MWNLFVNVACLKTGYVCLEVFTESIAHFLFMEYHWVYGILLLREGLGNVVIGIGMREGFCRCEKYVHWRAKLSQLATQQSRKHLQKESLLQISAVVTWSSQLFF